VIKEFHHAEVLSAAMSCEVASNEIELFDPEAP
jgi:hypothetical protein